MTEHVREAEVHYVDAETCVHRLTGRGMETPGRHGAARTATHHPAAQCPRPPSFLVAGIPVCDHHVVPIVIDQHARGNPDPVVRRWV